MLIHQQPNETEKKQEVLLISKHAQPHKYMGVYKIIYPIKKVQ